MPADSKQKQLKARFLSPGWLSDIIRRFQLSHNHPCKAFPEEDKPDPLTITLSMMLAMRERQKQPRGSNN
jgi:hypothetical protein